jgi:hypothetical protein
LTIPCIKPVLPGGDDYDVESSEVWMALAGGALLVVAVLAVHALWSRAAVDKAAQRTGTVWKRAYHLGAEIAAGRRLAQNRAALIELIDTCAQPMMVASALAVAVRQEPVDVDAELFSTIRQSRLPALLRDRIDTDESQSAHHATVEALEIIEVLRVYDLLGDAAALTRHADPAVVRAACDAVVELEPSVGLGILIGMVDGGESWVLDSLGRATDNLNRRGPDLVPLAQAQWRSAPMLVSRALTESATFDRATVTDAVGTLISALDDRSSTKRLAAVKALSASIDHPGAQLALAGALGSEDRMTRFAVAAALSDSVVGRQILCQAAADPDGSDAARMAAEILWTEDDHRRNVLQLVVS